MRIHQVDAADALLTLRSGPAGLTGEEAARRLAEFGPNRVEQIIGEAWWRRLAKGFVQFFALILWLAAALCVFAEWHQPGQGMLSLGAAIVGVILVNGLFSFWQEYRAERAIGALQRLLPRHVKTLRDGKVSLIETEDVVPGDVVLLSAGDDVPADCRVIEAYDTRVNNATITGESVPLARDARPSQEARLLAASNVLLAGTSLVSGEARAVVFTTGMHTEFGQIAHLTQTVGTVDSPLLREIRTLSRLVAALATVLGVGVFFIGRAVGLSFWDNFIFAIGIIVANVPEGLLPTVTLALAMGAQRLASRRALVRHLASVETLGSVTVICTDKTGTLTLNRLVAMRLFLGGRFVEAPHGLAGLPPVHRRFFEVAGTCHNLNRSNNGWLGDPLEVALVELAHRVLGDTPAAPRVDEIPFDSDRRRLSTLHKTGAGHVLYTKGALESLLPLCIEVQLDTARSPLNDDLRAGLLRTQEEMAANGLRVLALASRDVGGHEHRSALEQSLTLLGLVGFIDSPRPEVPSAVATCREAGIRVIMVTGDHPSTARAIALQIGMTTAEEARVMTGEELGRLTDTQLQLMLDTPGLVFARVSADQKMRIVRVLKRKGEVVAVTGDGVNDAPALRLADIGVAMGQSGTDVARESADMVLMDDNFASIVHAIEEGRAVYDNIRKFLTYILTSNVPEAVPYLAFVLFRIPLPLTIIQILAVDLGTDMLPALGLGAEPPRPEVMRRPPRRRSERLLDAGVIGRAYLFLGPLEAAAAMIAFFAVLFSGGWSYGTPLASSATLYRSATAACLAAIVVMQVANVLVCRDARISAFRMSPFGNPFILAGIATELILILAIVYTPVGNLIFGTAPIAPWLWALFLPLAVMMILAEEARKAVVRTRGRNG